VSADDDEALLGAVLESTDSSLAINYRDVFCADQVLKCQQMMMKHSLVPYLNPTILQLLSLP
jgi:hypothetical protein